MKQNNGRSIEPALDRLGISPTVSPPRINGLAFDSREVKQGFAFVCIPGQKVDGNDFIAEAVKNGASCIFSQRAATDAPVPWFKVSDSSQALAVLSDYFYDHPSQKLRPLGITGTNGKTTTSHIIEHILNASGFKSGLLGTLGSRWPGQPEYQNAGHTTPQSKDLHQCLGKMVEAGCTHVAMEVSSHALVQKRVSECQFAAACLTNISQDHLDFHLTMESYWQAKRILFEELNNSTQANKTAVINLDDPLAGKFLEACGPSITRVTYGFSKAADLNVADCAFDFSGTRLQLQTPAGLLDLKLKLSGRFNVYNTMSALAICLAEGVCLEKCGLALESFTGVAGRFEVVPFESGKEPLCIVDYAHTPDGLENVLKTARNLVPESGKLIVVFGCGGDRDASKRPQMGEIAEAMSDLVIITSDNPRSEDPQQIIANILAGIKRINRVKVEPDRARAIRLAVAQAGGKDIVVIAGKGHENYQILADRTIPFDDRTEVKLALKERSGSSI